MRPTDVCFPITSRRAPAPRRFPTFVGGQGSSRCLARFGGPRSLWRRGAFSSPRRGSRPSLWRSVARRSNSLRRAEIASRAVPVTRRRLPRSEPPSLAGWRALRPRALGGVGPWLAHSPIRDLAAATRSLGARSLAATLDPHDARSIVHRSLGPVRARGRSVRRGPSHASLGRAPPDDFCNTRHDARAHPRERPILVREILGEAAASFASASAEAQDLSSVHRAAPLARVGTPVKTSRARLALANGTRGPRVPEQRALPQKRSPPRTCPSSARVAARRVGKGWRLPPSSSFGRDSLSPPPREERRFPSNRGAFFRFEIHRPAPRGDSTFWSAARDCSRGHAPDRPSVTPPLTSP